jgi:hypothetical protein
MIDRIICHIRWTHTLSRQFLAPHENVVEFLSPKMIFSLRRVSMENFSCLCFIEGVPLDGGYLLHAFETCERYLI